VKLAKIAFFFGVGGTGKHTTTAGRC